MKTLIDIDDVLKIKFKTICAKKNQTMKQVIEKLIVEYIKNQSKI